MGNLDVMKGVKEVDVVIAAARVLNDWCNRVRAETQGICETCPFAENIGVCPFPVDGEPYIWDMERILKHETK